MAPTRRPRKFGAARQSAPIIRKNRSRRRSRSSTSDSKDPVISSERDIRFYRKQRKDGRGSIKERNRKAQLARNLPRRSNGKFAPRSGFVTPPNRSSRPPFQRDPSFLNYTDLTELISPENISPARYIEDLVQTPEGQQRLERSIVKSVEKVLDNATISLIERLKERFGEGTRLNFDSDSESDTEKVVDSASESDFREASFSMFYTSGQIFESDYGEASPLMKTLTVTESSGSLLTFDSHSESDTEESDSNSGSLLNCDSDDEQDRNKNPTPPRKRRYSS
uniref:Uncharacterized protein n=1 Tax=Panagrolaimus davidi TaxID=227884 RepID=A0A914Q501_9BILA